MPYRESLFHSKAAPVTTDKNSYWLILFALTNRKLLMQMYPCTSLNLSRRPIRQELYELGLADLCTGVPKPVR